MSAISRPVPHGATGAKPDCTGTAHPPGNDGSLRLSASPSETHAVSAPELNQPVFLTHKALRVRYGGVSRMWIPRRIKHDGFPASVTFGTLSTQLWRLAARPCAAPSSAPKTN
jgi:hypothetical protein